MHTCEFSLLLQYLDKLAEVSKKKQWEVCLETKCGPIQDYFQTKGIFCSGSLGNLIQHWLNLLAFQQ